MSKRARPAERLRRPPRRRRNIRRALLLGMPLAALLGFGVVAIRAGWAAETLSRIRQGALNVSIAAGFQIRELSVAGLGETDREMLRRAVGVNAGDPILAFDVQAAQATLSSLPWVRHVRVERRLPQTIFVDIDERAPIALWQNEGRLRLIDAEGQVLSDAPEGRFLSLPRVVGPQANLAAGELVALLQGAPEIAKLVEAAQQIGGRRWDLTLKGGMKLRLPEDGAATALAEAARLHREGNLSEIDAASLDLRLPGPAVFRLSPGASHRAPAKETKI